MNPIQDSLNLPKINTKQALIPEITLDPFSVAAYFTLYNVLAEKDRLAINYSHGVFLQKSNVIGILPFFNKEIDTQAGWRKLVYFNDRNEASDFVIAILESVSAYLKYESFKKMLPHLANGLTRYSKSYGTVSDNAKTSILFAVNRVKEAILCESGPEAFQEKYSVELPNELIENRVKYYDSHWMEEEIMVVVNLIQLAIFKNSNGQNCEAEVEATLKYLEKKQERMIDLLIVKAGVMNPK